MEAHGSMAGVLASSADAKRPLSKSAFDSPNSSLGKSPVTSDDDDAAPVKTKKMQPCCADGCWRCVTEETGGFYYVKSGVSFDKPLLCRFP